MQSHKNKKYHSSKSAIKKNERWCDDILGIEYAVGKINLIYLIFNRKRRNEFENLWEKHIEPIKDEDYKVRIIEEGKKYSFVAYARPNDELVLYKRKLDVTIPYSKFKQNLENDTIFTFAYKKGNNLRISNNSMILKDIMILSKSEISPDSIENLVLGLFDNILISQ
jgi:hypothetical protein